ncbi:MAG TPA: RdgB/HAM1 family non-canonical purine NTP pyrophosphatase [Candidatus Limnocylindria bacterium]|nr:RdgB/HAM1 family non-canonical purine NTP pyrophosphatase [Candidatus Limnocylindria bacterium]
MTERLLIGSGNPGKQREYRELLAGLDFVLVTPDELDPVPEEPEEDGHFFSEIALQKAGTYALETGLRTISDDSGLEVDALGGAPGYRSRRFFGEDTTAAERNDKLLALLDGVKERGARFVCAVVLASPDLDKEILTFEAEVRGEIALAPRGTHGFGYDPLFIIAGDGRTMAELPAHEKHRISHRGLAVAKLRAYLAGEAR